jgi:hypothetical protein
MVPDNDFGINPRNALGYQRAGSAVDTHQSYHAEIVDGMSVNNYEVIEKGLCTT